MKSIKVYHYDAFTKEANKGNPAGIVFDSDNLTEEEMHNIAHKVGFNETAFVLKSGVADLKLRYFTPGQEMSLCGHATIATLYALKTRGVLGDNKEITVETQAGILPIRVNSSTNNEITITMQQADPQFKEFKGSKKDLANLIGLNEGDIDDNLPVVYGSTGTWTLLVPIHQLSDFNKMKPENASFPSLLKEEPRASIHPFCLKTFDSLADMHGRHFSSPYSGTTEDPVTGTASGVMGAFYAKYIKRNDFDTSLNLIIEQGNEIQKDGRVIVSISKSGTSYDVKVTGNAVYVKKFEMII